MSNSARLRVVLDTNVLLVAISPRSKYHWIFQRLLEADYELLVSNEILSEYEEIIGQKLSEDVARNVLRMLLLLPNVQRVSPRFRWSLIYVDPDDNKFVDCAIAANAHALVTQDRHFNVLRDLRFPSIHVMSIADFSDLIAQEEQT